MVSEPVVLFFLLGAIAGLAKSDLKIPMAVYEALSIFLLLAIGIQGGVKLAEAELLPLLLPGLAVLLVAALIPLIAFPVLRFLGGMARADSASIAGHYGSVSVVTFSVAVAYLAQRGLDFEGHMIVFLVLLEIPAIVIGILLARAGMAGSIRWGKTLHEVFFGKSVFLLIGGLLIGLRPGRSTSTRWSRCSSTCSRACWRCSCWRWGWWPPAGSRRCAATGCSWSRSPS